MKDKILLVDDEPNVLSGYKRGLRQRFDVYTAEGGEKGLEAIEHNGPFAVVVADMRMPVMDGVQFLKKVKRIVPNTTRMMLTGNADQETAMQAVNMGAIFRFLTKPCPSNELTAALALGVRQYKLVNTEKEVLEQTLAGSIKILTDLLSITEPTLVAKAEKVCDYIRLTAGSLRLENIWELEMAAMLAPLGALTQPPELRDKLSAGAALTEKEMRAALEIPSISGKLLSNIPRLEKVSELVTMTGGMVDDAEAPVDSAASSTEKKLVKILSDLVELEMRGMKEADCFGLLLARPHIYDLELTQKIRQIFEQGKMGQGVEDMTPMEVRVKHLLNGDVLKQNVESLDDRLLLSKGTKITDVYLARLNNYRRLVGIQEPIQIYRKQLT